ncbi:tetratricopeptide repeat protein [Nocardia sp. alder85J]|uniref:tetratricopeptide repeat protein n=1 Tax=Nocardia sp. alder85J TaxID=2862949 RepID=UPI0022583566|nr:tetratricopeptide repeat protein [Nocardia sp. alder85J]MCX4097781.1 tetratricopeptide repeat protein [Nocardia sp. alder85J]
MIFGRKRPPAGQALPPVTQSVTVKGKGNTTIQAGGDAVVLPQALEPVAEVDAPPGLRNLPARPGVFVGRTTELARLDAVLSGPVPTGGVVVQAVHGLGGIGKSTLVTHWAATRPHGCAPVWWITADSPAAVEQGLADLAVAVQPLLARVLPAEQLAERGAQWLSTHTGWLLILDNVTRPGDVAAVTDRVTVRGGRVVITSRAATGWRTAAVIRLDVLTPGQSLELLTGIVTAAGPRDLDGAVDLCAELGQLPLAVEQAAAYLAQNPLTTPRTYRELLARYPAQMFGEGGVDTATGRSIARVWSVTLDRITVTHPAAVEVLRVLAWYAPDAIPVTLLAGVADPPALDAAIGILAAYSMITTDPVTATVSLHRLVQAVARTPDPTGTDPHRAPDAVDRARDHATTTLYTAIPDTIDNPADWPAWRNLLPHIEALTTYTRLDTDTRTTATLLHNTARFLNDQGRPDQAIPLFERTLTDRVRVLGDDHPGTLTSRNNLAGAYYAAGDLGRAIPLYERTLTDQVRVLGDDHPATLTSRNNLAYAYESAGDLGRAIPLYERTLTDRARVLGDDHPATLTSRNNLAGAYQAAGDLGRAIPLYERTLTDTVRVLGPGHPHTASVRANLAVAIARLESKPSP